MDKPRFSLLHLEPGEVYFQDFRANLKETTGDVGGWLKICSKSLVFEPLEKKKPIIKILLQHCGNISANNDLLTVESVQHVELLAGNVIAPYTFNHIKKTFSFSMYFIRVDDCLQHVLQLQRASSLAPPEQDAMIAAITYSRQCRLKFDPNALGDIFEEILLEIEASKVLPLVVNPGRVVLSSTRIYFQPFNNADTDTVLKMDLADVTYITKRRFLLRHVGVEMFCESAVKHLYLVFKTEEGREKFYDAVVSQPSLRLSSQQHEIMTLKWQNRVISNYEYLMYLNSIADRSVNDLTQYPVFPWVISDYTSDKIDLNDLKIYRDLSKPIGALNPDRLARLKMRRNGMDGDFKFLYGSHYSTPAFVLFYLVRKYPQYMLCLQNGRFDHPDRIFHNMSDVWRNVMENMTDFKELIPEFYDISSEGDFLLNTLRLELGTRHDGHKVHNVQLPPWCKDAKEFVKILRDALESEYVSENLPKWIDLVFGCKQRGPAAEEADNVFYHLCYEGAVNLDAVTDLNERHALEVQIMEFGQIPKKIFKVAHLQRLKPDLVSFIPNRGKSYVKNRKLFVLATHREPVTCVAAFGDVAISVGRDSVLKEFKCSSKLLIRSVNIGKAGISACVLLPDERTVVLGTFDNSIVIYDLERSKVNDEVRVHNDTVGTLIWNQESKLLASASWDGLLNIWKISPNGKLQSTGNAQIERDSKITCAAFDKAGELIACATEEGELTVFRIMTAKAVFYKEMDEIYAISFHENRLIVGGNEACYIYDIYSGLLVYSFCRDIQVVSFAWMNNALLIGSSKGHIQSWFVPQGEFLDAYLSEIKKPVTSMAVSTCGEFIVTAQGNQVILYQ